MYLCACKTGFCGWVKFYLISVSDRHLKIEAFKNQGRQTALRPKRTFIFKCLMFSSAKCSISTSTQNNQRPDYQEIRLLIIWFQRFCTVEIKEEFAQNKKERDSRTEILVWKCHLKCSTNVILTLVSVHRNKTWMGFFPWSREAKA